MKHLFFASLCGILWHILSLFCGSFVFEPPKTTDAPRKPQESAAKIVSDEASDFSRPWYHWDALWIVHLSRFGYVLETGHDGQPEQSNIAFTPGLPLVAAASARMQIRPWDFLLAFNLAAAFAAMMALGSITWRLTASRAAMVWAIAAFNLWPWRFFLVAPYQEAAGAALAFWGLYAAIDGRALPGFTLSFAASAFRLNAVGLFGGLMAGGFVEFLRGRDKPLQARRMIIGAGALLGWGLLLLHFRSRFGDAAIGVTIQAAWQRQPPHLAGIFESLFAPFQRRMTGTEWLDWAAAWIIIGAIPAVYARFGLVWASSLTGLTVQALSTGRVLSFGRFTLLACPAFMLAGQLASVRPKTAKAACFLGLILQVVLAWRYGHGLFAG